MASDGPSGRLLRRRPPASTPLAPRLPRTIRYTVVVLIVAAAAVAPSPITRGDMRALTETPSYSAAAFARSGDAARRGWSVRSHDDAGHRVLASLNSGRFVRISMGGGSSGRIVIGVERKGDDRRTVGRAGWAGSRGPLTAASLGGPGARGVAPIGVVSSGTTSASSSSASAEDTAAAAASPPRIGAPDVGISRRAADGSIPHDLRLAAYLATIEEVMYNRRIYERRNTEEDVAAVKAYALSVEPAVPTNLPSLSGDARLAAAAVGGEAAIGDVGGRSDEKKRRRELLRRELEAQRSAFLGATGWTDARHGLLLRVLSYAGNHCAKYDDAVPLTVAWEKIKESGGMPRENVLSTFLYVLSGGVDEKEEGGGEGSYIGDGGGGVDNDIPQEIATFHDILFQPTEKTISLRVKSHVARGDARGAEELLGSLPDDANMGNLKLRTYLPILALYCSRGDMTSALNLYKRMRDSPGVIFEAENYSMLIAAIAENGYFRSDAEPIKGAADLGYSPPFGRPLLNQLASEMAEDVLEITSACARRLADAFVAGFNGTEGTAIEARGGSDAANGSELPPNNGPAGAGTLIAHRVSVDADTALCPRSGVRLRLVKLKDEQRERVHETLVGMANDQYEAYNAKLVERNHVIENVTYDYAAKHLARFAEWMDEREGEPFTAVVDGANVAFFGQGVVDHYQIHLVTEALERMGETPLVILPEKYTAKKFHIRKGFVQELPLEQLEIIKRLEDDGKLYKVPKRCLDDYYWMLASVSNQTVSRNGTNLDVAPNNHGRWPGLRPIIISNDRMRDHKLELLEPRLFRRWYSNHIIRYTFGNFEEDGLDRDICFYSADFFSREIQGNPTPGGGSEAWHFPVSEWDWNERLCVRVPP